MKIFSKYMIITILFFVVILVFGITTLIRSSKDIASNTLNYYNSSTDSKINKLVNTFEYMVKDTNNLYDTNLAGKSYFIECFGLTQKLLDKDFIVDPAVGYIIKDNEECLHFPSYIYNTAKYADKLNDMVNYYNSLGIPFLYVMTPSKTIDGYTTYKPGFDVYANESTLADNFIDGLNQYNINYIDLRKLVTNSSLEPENLFFKTDHHWKTETAFWASTETLKKINSLYNISSDNMSFNSDLTNYDIKVYKNHFLGSLGKRMGRIYSGIDDYSLITPKFDTRFRLYSGFDKIPVGEGSFEDIIVKNSMLEEDKEVSSNCYSAYWGYDTGFLSVENLSCDNNYNVLIIKDSYGLPFSAFLALDFKEVSIVDFRAVKDKSVKEFIEKNDFDLIINIYGLGSFSDVMFTLK